MFLVHQWFSNLIPNGALMKRLILLSIFCIPFALLASNFPEVCEGLLTPSLSDDPFFKPRIMSTGAYAGECIDNEYRRNIVSLSKVDERLKKIVGTPKKGKLYFANFRHLNRYYIAEYTPGSIEKTFLVFEKFLEGGLAPRNRSFRGFKGSQLVFTGHIQFRYLLKKGQELRLYDQTSKQVTKSIGINDITYAMYAIRPESLKGQTYEPFGEGVNAGYALSHNFLSTHDVAIEYKNYIREDKARVGQYKLESYGLDFEKMFSALLKQSDELYQSSKTETYDTISNNCVTAAYTGVVAGDKGKGKSSPRWYRLYARHLMATQTNGREFNPMSVFADLERRKILTHRNRSQVSDFNDEICRILRPEFRPDGCH